MGTKFVARRIPLGAEEHLWTRLDREQRHKVGTLVEQMLLRALRARQGVRSGEQREDLR